MNISCTICGDADLIVKVFKGLCFFFFFFGDLFDVNFGFWDLYKCGFEN